jgi:hypothetical protein
VGIPLNLDREKQKYSMIYTKINNFVGATSRV